MSVSVRIPGGVWRDGTRVTDVEIRSLTGRDEEMMPSLVTETGASRSTAMLKQAVVSIGGREVDAADILDLTVGDREALLWHLRRITFGEQLEAVVDCSRCADKLDVEVTLGDLLQPQYEKWSESYEEAIAGQTVSFRLPTGRDQQFVAQLAVSDTNRAALRLLEACVQKIDGSPAGHEQLETLADRMSDRFSDLDPQAEAFLQLTCPLCDEHLSVVLDGGAFLFEEIVQRAGRLFQEVHALAWHYHWSENEILSLPSDRRRLYLDLIAVAQSEARGP